MCLIILATGSPLLAAGVNVSLNVPGYQYGSVKWMPLANQYIIMGDVSITFNIGNRVKVNDNG